MATTVLATYMTKSGKVAAHVTRYDHANGRVSFSWTGLYGAGCGPEADLIASVKSALARRKGITLAAGSDIATYF